MFPISGRCEAHNGTCMLPFEMMHQEENINKCLPPSTFKSPLPLSPPASPALQKATASHVTHYQGGRKHVFGIKLLRTLSNKIHFLIGSFHNIYILPFFFPLGGGCCWFAGCQVEVSHGGKVYEKQPSGESRRDRATPGEKERPCRHMKQNKQSDF